MSDLRCSLSVLRGSAALVIGNAGIACLDAAEQPGYSTIAVDADDATAESSFMTPSFRSR
jgi:hypothetical protein